MKNYTIPKNPIETLAGQYFDQETGLHYNYHRYYDPATGRYLTPDPIGLAGGTNLFAYVQNNPVNWIDHFGLEGEGVSAIWALSASTSSARSYYPSHSPSNSKVAEMARGAAYAVGKAAVDTADIAINGPLVAKATLGLAAVSVTAPVAVVYYPTAYIIAPYASGPVVNFTYGLFTETGPPQGWGYLSSFGMFIYQQAKQYDESNCEKIE